MAPIAAPGHVLLSGGTGFIGSYILKALLNAGFNVKAAVRSSSKATSLGSLFQSYVDSGNLTFTFVSDITDPTAFDEAVKGVEGIIHTASPLISKDPQADPQDLIGPAVNGTVGILGSALRNGNQVKRVVITSSIGTLFEPHEPGYIYSDADWNIAGPKLVAEQGRNAPGVLKYAASKTLAERAAWKWMEDNKPSFELSTTLPAWVFGKSLSSSPEHFHVEHSNYTLLRGLSEVKSGQLQESDYLALTYFVDVVDVAEGHLKALTTPEAGGKRLILSGGFFTWQDVFDLLNSRPLPGISLPVGTIGNGKNAVITYGFETEKDTKLLGMTYRPTKETIYETISQALELGWEQ